MTRSKRNGLIAAAVLIIAAIVVAVVIALTRDSEEDCCAEPDGESTTQETERTDETEPTEDSGTTEGSDPTQEPEGTETPTDPTDGPIPELHEVPEDPFLTDEEVNPVGTYSGFTRAPEFTPEPAQYAFMCLADIEPQAAEVTKATSWNHDLEGSVTEFVFGMSDLESAGKYAASIETLPEQCGEVSETHKQTVHQPTTVSVDGADEAHVWTVEDEPLPEDPGSEGSFHGVGLARAGNVIVIVTFGAMADPTDGKWNEYATTTLTAALAHATQG